MSRSTFLKEADARGFEAGWFDGLHGLQQSPKPALGIGLFDIDYMRAFKTAYADGYQSAKSEMKRRKSALRAKRATQIERQQERDNA